MHLVLFKDFCQLRQSLLHLLCLFHVLKIFFLCYHYSNSLDSRLCVVPQLALETQLKKRPFMLMFFKSGNEPTSFCSAYKQNNWSYFH